MGTHPTHRQERSPWPGTPTHLARRHAHRHARTHTDGVGTRGVEETHHSCHETTAPGRAAEMKARVPKRDSEMRRRLRPEAAGHRGPRGRPRPQPKAGHSEQADPLQCRGPPRGSGGGCPTPSRPQPGTSRGPLLERGTFNCERRLSLGRGEGGSGWGRVRGPGTIKVRVRPWGPKRGSSGSASGARPGAGGGPQACTASGSGRSGSSPQRDRDRDRDRPACQS